MKKIIGIAVLIGALGILAWRIYGSLSAPGQDFGRQRERVPVAVEVASVQQASIRKIGSFTGTLYPVSQFVMAPKIAGRLEQMLVDIGDQVHPGQLVAALDDDEYRQQVSQAKAELEVARATLKERENILDNAGREYKRTVALREKKIASESQLDAAASEFKTQQAKLDVARAQVAQKEAVLKMAEVRLSYTQIRVPQNSIPGYRVVGERFVYEGAMLPANKEIVSILDIGRLIAAIHVIERDYPDIRQGLTADVTTDAFPDRTFSGRVTRIAPLLQENSREARVEVEIPNDQNLLKPGMFVRVAIQFDQHDNATVVPSDALIKRNGIEGVFVADLETKKAHFVKVRVGIVSASQVEILSPSISGAVVTLGHHLLEDGGSILLPEAVPANSSPGSGPPNAG